MAYLRPILVLIVLFILTSLFCWLSYDLFLRNPLFSIGFYLVGVLGVVMAVDVIREALLP